MSDIEQSTLVIYKPKPPEFLLWLSEPQSVLIPWHIVPRPFYCEEMLVSVAAAVSPQTAISPDPCEII